MPFMEPQAEQMTMFVIETTHGTEKVPADVAGDVSTPAELADYLGGEPEEGAELERESGWYSRLSAPGYLDRTDWLGPYTSEARAFIELAETHDICALCWEGACWDGLEPCDESEAEAKMAELRSEAEAAEAADRDIAIDRERMACVFGLGGGELDDETFWLGGKPYGYTYEGLPHYVSAAELGIDLYEEGRETRTVIAYHAAELPAVDGWRQLARFASSGEADCWWCGAGCDPEEQAKRESCPLCEGDGYVYIGEPWAEHVITRIREEG